MPQNGPWTKYAKGDGPWSKYAKPSPESEAPDTIAQARQVIRDIPQESMLGRITTGPPLTGIESGLPSPAQVPENASAMNTGAMIGSVLGGGIAGGAKALPGIVRTLGGAFGGAALGGYGGRRLGGLVGHPEAGERLGTVGGSLLGGYGAYKTVPPEPPPEVFPVSKSPGPYRGPSSVPTPEPPLGSPENPGFSSKLSTRLPPNLRGDPFEPETSARKSVLGNKGVGVYPEPREPLPGDRPGAAWSQGREKTLPASASRGAPGAVDVLRNIGRPMVLTPRSGVGYPSPGEFEAIREPLLGKSTPFNQPEPAPVEPEGAYQPGEREGYLESVIRGAPGENPSYRALLKNLQKTRKPPIF